MQWAQSKKSHLLVGILLAAAALRLYGLNWDGGQWLHPDERQIYFLALDLGWPSSLGQALKPDSPLNPGFFAYGSLSIYLLRGAAALLALVWPTVRDPGNLHLVGRPLAAMLDVGTVYLTYRLGIGRARIGRAADRGEALLAAGLVAAAVIHVQSAHFYIADVLLTFLVLAALNLAFDVAGGGGRATLVGLGVAIGLALATKVSVVPLLLLPIAAFWARRQRIVSPIPQSANRPIYQRLLPIAFIFLVATATFVVVQPYALIDLHTFLSDTAREAQIASGRLDVPYTQQYTGTWPYLYPAWQTALWGLGLPIGLAAWAGFGALAVRWLQRGQAADTLLLAWAGPYFALAGMLHAKPLRYMLPLVPVLCLLAAEAIWRGGHFAKKRLGIKDWALALGYLVSGAAMLGYAIAFVGMYREAHPWVDASTWIYQVVEQGSVVTVEHWDTPLPLPLEVQASARRIEEYDLRTLGLYDEPDDAEKWQKIAATLAQSDYVVIASRRLYGSLPRVPDRYPIASHYHSLLFEGNLGFRLAGEFTRGPGWLNPKVPPLPGSVPWVVVPDESLVVYDHPRTLIFQNVARLQAEEMLEQMIGSGQRNGE